MNNPQESLQLSASGAPRYQQLAESLKRGIETGHYPVGTMLPPEPRLSQQFAVSRHTVREAIRRLADMGLVSRHQGIGTRVRASNASSRYVASLSTLADLMQYTQQTRLHLIGTRTVEADDALAQTLHCRPGQHWIEYETCRFPIGEDTPIAHTRIYVYPGYERIGEHLKDASVWVYGLIEEHYGERIVEVQQEIGAITITAGIARALGVKPRSPGLQVLRYYLGRDDRLLSVSMNIYPENRFKISTRWRLESG